jgi:hypothetical protein
MMNCLIKLPILLNPSHSFKGIQSLKALQISLKTHSLLLVWIALLYINLNSEVMVSNKHINRIRNLTLSILAFN